MNSGQTTFLASVFLICVCCATQQKQTKPQPKNESLTVPLPPSSAAEVASGTVHDSDEFAGSERLVGPKFYAIVEKPNDDAIRAAFLGTISDSNGIRHSLCFVYAMEDLAMFGEVRTSDQEKLAIEVTQDHQGGKVMEVVLVKIPPDLLQRSAKNGLRLRLYGGRMRDTVDLPPRMFEGHLVALERSGFR